MKLLPVMMALCLFACHPAKPVKRYGMVTGLKPEKVAYYKQLHAAAWPGVLKTIKACNIDNYSIYLQKIDDKYILFSYFEYTGTNFNAPSQLPLPGAAGTQSTWTIMEEVFHTPGNN
ncbi:MAG TPA: L-rhamnose mutarotase [Chitinophaga sp.]|uniref:L-rhamnose mutarotase n=1 Tax=Chitinophaga sp. TaxID=1869181 RepID=UPI002F925B33